MTATTDTGELPTVSSAPSAHFATVAGPGVAATVPGPATAHESESESGSESELATASSPGTSAGGLVDPGPRPLARLRALRGQGLTGPGGALLAVLLLAPGVLVDRWLDGSFGLPSMVAFVLASLAVAAAVRISALGTAAVLPPLLFAGAVTVLAWASGNNRGTRELAFDVGTTMAVSAPVLFLGAAAALAVVLGRLVVRVFRR